MFEGSRVRAVVFDLDGTLVETEHLKAEAYADLIGTLTGRDDPEPAAIELYRSIVGARDMAVCDAMIERFELHPLIETEPGETHAEALHRMRMEVYRRSYGTPPRLQELGYEHNIALVHAAYDEGIPVGVATMSFASEARRVIDALGLSDIVAEVVGVDDVARPKPAPDAFLLAMDRLGVKPEPTLVIEDSPTGALAAKASGARWLCVATEFSSQALSEVSELESEWIVRDPARLTDFVTPRVFT